MTSRVRWAHHRADSSMPRSSGRRTSGPRFWTRRAPTTRRSAMKWSRYSRPTMARRGRRRPASGWGDALAELGAKALAGEDAEITGRLQRALGSGYRIERELKPGGMSRVFVAEDMALRRRRGDQGARPASRRRARCGPVPSRDPHRRWAAASPHPAAACRRRRRRTPLLHHAVRGGRVAPGPDRPDRGDAGGGGLPHPARGRRCAGVCPSARHHPPRPQAGQHPDGRGPCAHHRFRHRQGSLGRRRGGAGAAGATSTGSGAGHARPTWRRSRPPATRSITGPTFTRSAVSPTSCWPARRRSPADTAQALLAAHLADVPEPVTRRRAGIPRALAELVMRLLAKRRSERPASADEVLSVLDTLRTADLEPVVGGRDTAASALDGGGRPRRRPGRHGAGGDAPTRSAVARDGDGRRRSGREARDDRGAAVREPGTSGGRVFRQRPHRGDHQPAHRHRGIRRDLAGECGRVSRLRPPAPPGSPGAGGGLPAPGERPLGHDGRHR